MSNKHKALEERFRKLPDNLRTPQNYVEHCLSAGIRQSAIDNRLSALDLFRADAPKKPAKVVKPEREPAKEKSEHDESTREGREAAAADRLEKRRRAWQAEYEPVDEDDEKEK